MVRRQARREEGKVKCDCIFGCEICDPRKPATAAPAIPGWLTDEVVVHELKPFVNPQEMEQVVREEFVKTGEVYQSNYGDATGEEVIAALTRYRARREGEDRDPVLAKLARPYEPHEVEWLEWYERAVERKDVYAGPTIEPNPGHDERRWLGLGLAALPGAHWDGGIRIDRGTL